MLTTYRNAREICFKRYPVNILNDSYIVVFSVSLCTSLKHIVVLIHKVTRKYLGKVFKMCAFYRKLPGSVCKLNEMNCLCLHGPKEIP